MIPLEQVREAEEGEVARRAVLVHLLERVAQVLGLLARVQQRQVPARRVAAGVRLAPALRLRVREVARGVGA